MGRRIDIFKMQEVGKGIYRIEATGSVHCYLILGKTKACLIDTLTGLGDLKGYVESITTLPIIVLNTHAHIDHLGGDFAFETVYMPRKDFPLIAFHSNVNERYEYEKSTMEARGQMFPYEIEDFEKEREIEYLPVDDEKVFDLGGRTLTAIEIPGHTKGSTAYFDSLTQTVFSGDCGNDRTFLFLEGSTTVAEYKESLERYKIKWNDRVNHWFISHNDTEKPLSIIDELLDCCNVILAGKETGPEFVFGQLQGEIKAKMAYPVDSNDCRTDGKQGNIVFDIKRRY